MVGGNIMVFYSDKSYSDAIMRGRGLGFRVIVQQLKDGGRFKVVMKKRK